MISVALIGTPERVKKHHDWYVAALDSIEQQTFRDKEIIIQVGDHSTAENHNRALMRCGGEYVKFVADDDVLPPMALEHLYRGIQGYDFVCGNAREFGMREAVYKSKPAGIIELCMHNTIHGATTMYRVDALLSIGGYDEELICAEEFDLHLALLKKGYRLGYVDEVVYNYRIHNEQKSNGALSQGLRAEQKMEIIDRYV